MRLGGRHKRQNTIERYDESTESIFGTSVGVEGKEGVVYRQCK